MLKIFYFVEYLTLEKTEKLRKENDEISDDSNEDEDLESIHIIPDNFK